MKLISQIVMVALAIMLLATFTMPMIDDVAPEEEGEKVVIDGKNDGFAKYAKSTNFEVFNDPSDGISVYAKDLGEQYSLSADNPIYYLFGNHFQIYRHNNTISVMEYGESSLVSSSPGKVVFESGTLTLYNGSGTVTKTVDYPDAYLYVKVDSWRDNVEKFVRSDGTDGAIFNTDTTIDGGHMGSSPRGFVQIIDGKLTPKFWGGNSGYGTINMDATQFALETVEEDTTLVKISNNTLNYTPTGSAAEIDTMDIWFVPYEYHFESESGGGTSDANSALIRTIPFILIALLMVGVTGWVTMSRRE